jgi:hypothetical protein
MSRAAENSAETAAVPRGRPFVKGQSGNPGGRPRSFAAVIRAHTRDGEELVRFMLKVFRGELADAKVKDRVDAATWLADRGFGKPTQGLEVTGREGEALLPVALVQAAVVDAERAGTN